MALVPKTRVKEKKESNLTTDYSFTIQESQRVKNELVVQALFKNKGS